MVIYSSTTTQLLQFRSGEKAKSTIWLPTSNYLTVSCSSVDLGRKTCLRVNTSTKLGETKRTRHFLMLQPTFQKTLTGTWPEITFTCLRWLAQKEIEISPSNSCVAHFISFCCSSYNVATKTESSLDPPNTLVYRRLLCSFLSKTLK